VSDRPTVAGPLARLGPWGYVAIYLGWAWLFRGVVVLSGRCVWTFPNVLLSYVGAISPATRRRSAPSATAAPNG